MNKYFWDVIENHYFDFKGRATRKQFWMWFLWMILVVIFVSLLRMIPAGNILGIMILLGLTLPNWAMMTRRVRDAGFSPWLVLLAVPNVIANIWSQFSSGIGLFLLLFSIIALICFLVLFIIWFFPSKN